MRRKGEGRGGGDSDCGAGGPSYSMGNDRHDQSPPVRYPIAAAKTVVYNEDVGMFFDQCPC